jgi:hypothetical protein
MNEKFLAQLIAELQNAQTEAFALLTQAMCRQLDPKRLRTDLETITQTYLQMPKNNPLAVKFLQGALAAAHAEQMLQGKPASEGPHPNRGD